MTEDGIAVRVQGVCKDYRLWSSPRDRLISSLTHLVRLPRKYPQARTQTASYREFCALKNISFTIRQGESWGFIGVNGSGKSTLLKIICGNLRPSAGRVEVDGRVVILDYSNGFNGDLTGKENIYLKATLFGLTRKQIKERYDAIVAFSELGDFINQPIKTYSSGMVSRLGFAIVAHVDADIIITDEALAVGDVFFVQKCTRFIRDFLKRGTFLFVSHSMTDVLSLCQKAVWLEHGIIKFMGAAANVTQAYLEKAQSQDQQAEVSAESRQAKAAIVLGPERATLHPLQTAQASRDMKVNCVDQLLQMPLFKFNDKESGEAQIISVVMTDDQNKPCSKIVGGELVNLSIEVLAKRELHSPVIGFHLLDRLGQILCAENSFFAGKKQPFVARNNTVFSAKFTCYLPLLPAGDYVIRAFAAAMMADDNPEMLHTMHNAIVIHSVTTGSRHGLAGLPMLSIQFKYEEARDTV